MRNCFRLASILAALVQMSIAADGQTQPSSASQRARRTPIVDVFERTKDAVVNIAATQIVERRVRFSPFDELFDPRLFGDRTQRYKQTSLGSGAVIHPEGYVITNAHVVARAAELKIIFANKTEHAAEAVSVDEQHDLAVLKIKDKGPFPAVILGRSNDLMIGETVIAIGNPLGYEHTVTTGIVSALNRELPVGNDVVYRDLIQTDASINRGNS
ncbi:MAG: trypsin-like peptidase domain-containing protein, partial [Planctomycetes bacterium]|nr:trypsin-like peptidase domain-containing protein [Planctomycetota bacterium]